MKIMTFNTQHCQNYITRKIDFEAMAKVIRDSGADFVGLNEMRGKGTNIEYEKQVEILSSLTGMKYYGFGDAIMVGGENPYGNGFLSNIPVVEWEKIMIPDSVGEKTPTHETRCILKITLEGGITVLVTHFGLNDDEKENAVKTVLENLENEKCILMGDFNVTPDDEFLTPIKERMTDTADAFSAPLLSFPSDEPRIKIDYIFVSRDIKVISADIPAIIASDHRPHTAEIEF
ncbi:MAG: endonuclease/exonuclease/phosphatase family protein [Clostridia bacterium]|nr:endonuclease/exonuclease/phosphatase family protein [Clostridia bacterium]